MTAARIRAWIPETAFFAIWSSSAFLFYLGSFVMLFAILWLLESLNGPGQDFGLVGWSSLALAAFVAAALLLRRAGMPILAGLAAFLGLIVFAAWAGSILDWIGFSPDDSDSSFGADFEPSILVLEVLVLAAGLVALRVFRFPLLVLPLAITAWYTFVGNISLLISDPSDEVLAVVGIIVGLGLVAGAVWLDRSDRAAYAFWLHVVGSVSVGGGILELLGSDDWAWALGGLISLVYIALARVFARSSYAVIGAIGVLVVGSYFIEKWYSFISLPFFFDGQGVSDEKWKGPVAYIGLGVLLVVLGFLVDRGVRFRGHRASAGTP